VEIILYIAFHLTPEIRNRDQLHLLDPTQRSVPTVKTSDST